MTPVVVVATAVVVTIAVKVSMAALPGVISDGGYIKKNDEPREQEEIGYPFVTFVGLSLLFTLQPWMAGGRNDDD